MSDSSRSAHKSPVAGEPGGAATSPGSSTAACCCCGEPAPIRGGGDPWEGRLDGYCNSCASTRCDTSYSTCAVKGRAKGGSAAQGHRRENLLVWIQVVLLTIGATAMIWGAFAHIGWLFWGIGLPVAIIALVYTFVAVGFIQLWAKERLGH